MQFNTDLYENILAVTPEILVVLLGALVLGMDLYSSESRRGQVGYVAGIGMLFIALINVIIPIPQVTDGNLGNQLVLGGMLRHDEFTAIFRTMVYVAAGLTCLIAIGDHRLRYKGEFYLVVMVASLGAGLMGGASDLIMVFVSLETLSILLYSLAGFIRPSEDAQAASRSAESGMKYFLLGSFASGFTLYGFSLIFGFTGETNLYAIGQSFANGALSEPPLIVALLMVLVGFGFKISAVPFHFWTPDVYEGSPTAMTAYVSVASKAASFALLLRFLLAVFPPSELLPGGTSYADLWVPVMVILSIITMTVGNLLALYQKNIKRLLAYSSIAQAGYTLMGVAAISTTEGGSGASAVAYYMFMYVLTNILAFGCIIIITNATGSEEIVDMAGLGRRNRWLAIFMTIALLSLAGIPPGAGFAGKAFLFLASVDSGLVALAIIAFVNSIVALYYYLVVIKVMFVDGDPDDYTEIRMSNHYFTTLLLITIGVIFMGTVAIPLILPWANEAGLSLFTLIG